MGPGEEADRLKNDAPGARRLEDARRRAWRVQLTLAAPGVPAALFAVFSEDPRAAFRANLALVGPAAPQKTAHAAHLASAWDRVFRSITGDRVYLLAPLPGVCTLMSNEAGGRKWIATRSVWRAGTVGCWCARFTAKAGQRASVKLDRTNLLKLERLARAKVRS